MPSCGRAEVRLHVPLKIPVERLRIEVVEELHANKALLVVALEFEVAVDLAVVRLDKLAPVVTTGADSEGVATVGILIIESLRIPIFSIHFKHLPYSRHPQDTTSNNFF